MTLPPGVGVLTTDADLVVRSWSAWLARVTGVPAVAACGRPLTELSPDLSRNGASALVRAALTEGATGTLPAWPLLAARGDGGDGTGDDTVLHALVGPLRANGHITGVIVTVNAGTVAPGPGRNPVEGLRAERWQARRAAVTSFGRSRDAGLVSEVLRLLREEHRDLDVATSALALLASADVDVVEPLIELLGATQPDLRVQATLLLGDRRDTRAVSALLGALDDSDPNVRFQAIESLGRLEAREAAGPLTAIAETGDFFLAFPALSALVRVGDRSLAPRLLPLLDVPMLSEAAADALGHLGGEDAIAPLLAMLDARDAPVAAVASAIDRLAERRGAGPDSLVAAGVRAAMTAARAQRLVEAVQQVGVPARPLARVLGWLEGPAVERALTRMLGRADAREEAVQALVAAGPRVVHVLIDQLGAEDLETRRAAVTALARIRDSRAVPALIDVLRDPELLPLVAGALGGIADPRAFDPLVELLGHEVAAVRQAAIAALLALRHPESERRVLALLDDPDPRRREAAAKLAPRLAPHTGVEPLRRACVDAIESVRRAAVTALARLDDPRALPIVLDTFRDGAPPVRAAAARALADVRSTSPGIALALLDGLGDPDAWVRYFAARALGHRRAVGAVAALARLIREDPAPHVSIAAAEALADIGGGDALAVVASLRGSANADLARVARAATSPAESGAPVKAAPTC